MSDNLTTSQPAEEPRVADTAAPAEPRTEDTRPPGEVGIAYAASSVTLSITDTAPPAGTWIADTPPAGDAKVADAPPDAEPYAADTPPAELSPAELSPPRETFRAGKALAMLLLVFGTQIAVGVVIAIAVAIVAPRDQFTSTLARLNGPLLLIGGGIALVMTWALAKAWAPAWLLDRTLKGLGPLALSPRLILTTALAGVALGSAFHLTVQLIPVPKSFHLGPLADIADKGGGGRLAWAVVALLLAPAAEELLFRGLLLQGLTVSWGIVPASVCVTLLFTGAHLTETLGYWPAIVAIFCLSIATLTVRLRSGVLPAAVLHASYNLVLVMSLYTSRIV